MRGVLQERDRVRPVAHEHRLAILKRESGVLLLPAQRVGGDNVVSIDGIAHEFERAHGRLGIDDHASVVIENAAAKAAEMFEEHRDETFVARPLPDESIRDSPVGAPREQFGEIGRRVPHQVSAPIQHADVDEPGQGVDVAPPSIGGHRRREEVFRMRLESIERENPSGGGELRRPDHVELQNVRFRCAGIEPLHVQLVTDIRRIGRGSNVHARVRMKRLKSCELPLNDSCLSSDRARRHGQRRLARARRTRGYEQRAEEDE